MAEGEVTRRLTTIVAIDVAGYSRLMGADEAGTLARLKEHRAITDPIAESHGGRIVGTAGDGLLLEFPSVVEAVTCAVAVQKTVVDRNADLPDDEKMLYRVGINLGDILVDGDEIYGDGVNVAARIEALAEPGGICISHTVHDQIRDRMDIVLEDMGEVEVKNIARPVRVYRVLAEGAQPAAPVRRASRRVRAAVLAVVVTLLIAGGSWWWLARPDFEPLPPGDMALLLPEKPSIAVLPFQNMSGDPEQAYFADGMAEDIITDLSKLSGLLVISRNSSFAYRGDSINVKRVGRELGVKYVLEGSVRRAGDQVRINVQLIDAQSEAHIWAERYDGTLTDVFALQDSVTRKIINALTPTLKPAEQQALTKVETGNAEAYDLVLRGIRHLNAVDEFHAEENIRARDSFVNAILLDDELARPYAGLAWTYWNDFTLFNLSGTDKDRALEFARKSIAIRDNALARRLIAQSHLQLHSSAAGRVVTAREYDEALSEMRKARALEPNNADALAELAYTLIYAGELDEAESLMTRARRLNPNFPNWYHQPTGIAYYLKGDYDLAIKEFIPWFENTISRSAFSPAALWLAAAQAQAGHVSQAEAIIEKMADWTLGINKANIFAIRLATPLKNAEHLNRFIEGLRRAGVPEEPEAVQ